MAEDLINPVTGRVMGATGGPPPTVHGESRSGDVMAGTPEAAKAEADRKFNEEAETAYKKEKKWTGIGGAAKIPTGWRGSKDYKDWLGRYRAAKSAGQKKAVSESK